MERRQTRVEGKRRNNGIKLNEILNSYGAISPQQNSRQTSIDINSLAAQQNQFFYLHNIYYIFFPLLLTLRGREQL